ALTKPGDSTHLVLVDGFGNYLSTSVLDSYASVKNFLSHPSLINVANPLSIQLLTTEINVLLHKVDAQSSIFVPAVTIDGTGIHLPQVLQDTLTANGVTNSSGIGKVQNFLDASIAQLLAHPFNTILSSDGIYDATLAVCLDAINENQSIFIL